MTRCRRISIRCTNAAERAVRVDLINEPVALCEPCIDYATRQGMNPRPIPEWMSRGMTGQNAGKDLTGAAA